MKTTIQRINTTMKNLKNLFAIFALAGFAALSAHAQTILSSTTLGAAITATNQTTITLASTSTMQTAGPVNQVNTVLYVDKELMNVQTVVDSTHVVVKRATGPGYGGRPVLHANGATVYFSLTSTNGNFITPAASYFNTNSGPITYGSCTYANEVVLPRIYTFWGKAFDCIGSQWVRTDTNENNTLATGVTVPAGTFTPTATVMVTDTGTSALVTLNVPNGAQPGFTLKFIPGGAFTTTNAGNIRIASTAVAGKTLSMTWDGSKWDPSY